MVEWGPAFHNLLLDPWKLIIKPNINLPEDGHRPGYFHLENRNLHLLLLLFEMDALGKILSFPFTTSKLSQLLLHAGKIT